jgi:hypothetical protein
MFECALTLFDRFSYGHFIENQPPLRSLRNAAQERNISMSTLAVKQSPDIQVPNFKKLASMPADARMDAYKRLDLLSKLKSKDEELSHSIADVRRCIILTLHETGDIAISCFAKNAWVRQCVCAASQVPDLPLRLAKWDHTSWDGWRGLRDWLLHSKGCPGGSHGGVCRYCEPEEFDESEKRIRRMMELTAVSQEEDREVQRIFRQGPVSGIMLDKSILAAERLIRKAIGTLKATKMPVDVPPEAGEANVHRLVREMRWVAGDPIATDGKSIWIERSVKQWRMLHARQVANMERIQTRLNVTGAVLAKADELSLSDDDFITGSDAGIDLEGAVEHG